MTAPVAPEPNVAAATAFALCGRVASNGSTAAPAARSNGITRRTVNGRPINYQL